MSKGNDFEILNLVYHYYTIMQQLDLQICWLSNFTFDNFPICCVCGDCALWIISRQFAKKIVFKIFNYWMKITVFLQLKKMELLSVNITAWLIKLIQGCLKCFKMLHCRWNSAVSVYLKGKWVSAAHARMVRFPSEDQTQQRSVLHSRAAKVFIMKTFILCDVHLVKHIWFSVLSQHFHDFHVCNSICSFGFFVVTRIFL